MGKCTFICELFAQINWWAYAGSVIVAYALGALWHSVWFAKTWKEVNKIDCEAKVSTGNTVATMLIQLLSTALTGLTFFVLMQVSWALAVLVAVAVTGWMKSTLKFRFADWKTFVKAAICEAGYFAAASVVFILFALL